MFEKLKEELSRICQEALGESVEPELSRPDEKFGDNATNVALKLAKKLSHNPSEVAAKIATELENYPIVSSAKVAGPGFINIHLSDEALLTAASRATDLDQLNSGQEIVLEHTDPNPFKEFHIGHAYSNTVGVAIGKLLQSSGAHVHQVTYQGDVGLHIAMAVWAIQKNGLSSDGLKEGSIGGFYAKGAQAYEEDEAAKVEIEDINRQIYAGDNEQVNQIYKAGRELSLTHFEAIYKILGADFEKNYFESQTAAKGAEIVRANLGKVFLKSEGAIIYDGEKAGLHKRVFITKQNLPTYEAKEIGLAFAKEQDYPQASRFVVVTANEIEDYFKVLLAALKEIEPALAAKITHLSHGVVRFPECKMSSRTGKEKQKSTLQRDVEEAVKEMNGDQADSAVVLGAIKYQFLKHRLGSDFIFDVNESISLEGYSGPFLQYARARADGILALAN